MDARRIAGFAICAGVENADASVSQAVAEGMGEFAALKERGMTE